MTNQQRDAEYDVTFTGRELLCIPDPEPPIIRVTRRIWAHRPESLVLGDAATILACFKEARPYSRGELRYRSGLDDDRFNVAIRQLARERVLEQIGYGLWQQVH